MHAIVENVENVLNGDPSRERHTCRHDAVTVRSKRNQGDALFNRRLTDRFEGVSAVPLATLDDRYEQPGSDKKELIGLTRAG
jgi:hypothetical protein